MPLRIDIITLFPDMLTGFLDQSMMKRASDLGAVAFRVVDLRDFTTDRHRTADDRPFGGGPGMVLKPEPLFAAIESLRAEAGPAPGPRTILLSPSGTPFRQARAERFAREAQHLILVCGHYEGVDQRVIDGLVDEEISIGDYVLTNGTLPAAVLSDAIVRLLPGVLGGEGATEAESFAAGHLEGPHYTRPAEFRGLAVPGVLLSGNHAEIEAWRQARGLEKTRQVRPDLLGRGDGEAPDRTP